MTDFDFDLRGSDVQVGIEIEYPSAEQGYEHRGGQTMSLQSSVDSIPMDGRPVYDGTVGLEIVSNVLPVADAPAWYGEVIDFIEAEYNVPYNPVGILGNGSTAGCHIHISPLSTSEAKELFQFSQEPWAQVLFCSSIAKDGDDGVSWPVFRGGEYCQMDFNTGPRSAHYACINQRGPEHWEWRMPEPMRIDHVEILARFLSLFKQDTELAVEYAQELLDKGDDRITSIWRAGMVGMDVHDVPSVRRQRAPVDPEDFYDEVEAQWALPEIYDVEYEGSHYYVFESRIDGEFNVEGVRFHPDDILYADSLEQVHDGQLAGNIRRAFEARNANTRRTTEATDELKKIVKKKK